MARTAWSREGPSGSLREVAIAVGALGEWVGERSLQCLMRVSGAAIALFEVPTRGVGGGGGRAVCVASLMRIGITPETDTSEHTCYVLMRRIRGAK